MHIKQYAKYSLFAGIGVLCALLLFGSCSQKQQGADAKQETATLTFQADSPEQVANSLLAVVSRENMERLPGDRISTYYGFDPSLLEDSAVYISKKESLADEIAVFQLKSAKESDKVLKAVKERINVRAKSFETLSPSEYEKFNHVIALDQNGYVVLVICGKADAAREILQKYYVAAPEKKEP